MTRTLTLALALLLTAAGATAQQSDYQIKTDFERRYAALQSMVEKAAALSTLDSAKDQIDALELDFTQHAALLDKVFYPESFAQKMTALRNGHLATYDRVYLIQTQGVHITELEARILSMTGEMDSLTAQRSDLFRQLEERKGTEAQLRETIRRLSANLTAKDRLLFSLVDSLFIAYGRDISGMTEMQREALGRKLENAGVVDRIADVAAENLRFLEVTSLQPKDYTTLVDQYTQFSNRWKGLGDKITTVVAASSAARTAAVSGTRKGTPAPPAPAPGVVVDSLLTLWQGKLMNGFWSALEREFTDRQVNIPHFTDPASFSASIRTYVDTLKASGANPSVFVNDIWKERIDKEWRESLIREKMLGKAEYAALDRLVSELAQEKLDQRFLIYSLIVVALVLVAWWVFTRKPKTPPPAQASSGNGA
jgi:uncharacterized small protein (DUF1192 family)